MKSVSTTRAPEARGHYSQAIVHGGLVYVAGQLPVVPGEPERNLAGFDEQVRQTLANVIAILEAAGSGKDLIVRATVYLAGVEHWPALNKVYAEVLGAHRPARTVVPVPGLHYGYLVEIDAIGALRDS
ncbi:RidA family protein [Usitatibacter palustris]|uniref:2-iminobutanoate/2-iminopropanoate deaminase n=1 Tax=Usitatibacter palustris TaxID=2732487 RepID=A0A6M4H6D5_9PROT|nr:RidA family protein [Usitatibacter palustris]QJR15186.1 2-iminobutanoate/2-iminopropanoate deaminase [Usitatibacter palustris]